MGPAQVTCPLLSSHVGQGRVGAVEGRLGKANEPHLIHMKCVSHGIERLLHQQKGQGVRGYQTNEHLCSV